MHDIAQAFSDAVNLVHDKHAIQALVKQLYAEDAVFEDPLQHFNGRDAIASAFVTMGRLFSQVDFLVLGEVAGEGLQVIHWEMRFKLRGWPVATTIPGVSWLSVNAQGQIAHQVDYWDTWTFMRRLLPVPAALKDVLPLKLQKLVA